LRGGGGGGGETDAIISELYSPLGSVITIVEPLSYTTTVPIMYTVTCMSEYRWGLD
jgi:hypothetical protein